MKILVLDDSHDRHVFFYRWLRSTEKHDLFPVETAADAMEALAFEALEQRPFDLVFLDHDLGAGLSGQVVAEYIVAMTTPPKYVIVHSANPDGSLRMIQTLRAGGIAAVGYEFPMLMKYRPVLAELLPASRPT